MKHPIAKIYTNQVIITAELYPEYAPNTVNSFIWCITQGMYTNRLLSRVVPGFVIQSTYDFSKEPDCDLVLNGEFASNGFNNPIQFGKGVLGMAGDASKEAHGCGFFITLSDDVKERLQGKFAAFGRVIDGFKEIERIENVPLRDITEHSEGPDIVIKQPITDEFIKKIEIETFGVEYPKPEILRWGYDC